MFNILVLSGFHFREPILLILRRYVYSVLFPCGEFGGREEVV